MSRFASLCLLSAVSLSSATQLDTTLKSVELRYNRAQTLQLSFTEAYSGPNRPQKMENGTLFLRKPGRMRWDYSTPAGKLFLSDGKNLYLFTPGSNRVEKMKLKETDDMRAPLAFLLGKLNFQKEFQNIQARAEDGETWITAEPKSPDLPYNKVEFAVTTDFRLRRVQVTGYDHSTISFTFENEKLNPALDARLFQLRLPPGAELVEEGQ